MTQIAKLALKQSSSINSPPVFETLDGTRSRSKSKNRTKKKAVSILDYSANPRKS